jgi:hypothetical protein
MREPATIGKMPAWIAAGMLRKRADEFGQITIQAAG